MGEAVRIQQRGTFHLDLPPETAFKLFTAAGERLWVPGWSPTILGPLPQAPGLVFTTGEGAEHTIWAVIDSDRESGLVRYSRVTPGSRAGIVTVTVTKTAVGAQIDVAYDLTALRPEGETALQAYAPDPFAQMMQDWHRLITNMPAEQHETLSDLVV
jgi:hypothetical protein